MWISLTDGDEGSGLMDEGLAALVREADDLEGKLGARDPGGEVVAPVGDHRAIVSDAATSLRSRSG